MKVKVIIENGETQIILTPENEFEKHVIEKVKENVELNSISTGFLADVRYGSYENHRIHMLIKEITP